MMTRISTKVASLGYELPEHSSAVGSYVPRIVVNNVLYISGQLPIQNGSPSYVGRILDRVDRRGTGVDRRKKDRLKSDLPALSTLQEKSLDRRSIKTVSLNNAIIAARLCALNIISHIIAETDDDITRVAQIIRLGGFVASNANFQSHPQIINGASDLMVAVFGDQVGQHVRAATGASSLPLGVPVEVEATVLLKK